MKRPADSIMLDQFEEYFVYRAREPVPGRFADELARCINGPHLRANFLIAIREDAYAGLGDLFKGRIANVYGNYLHIEYLDRASAEEAIRAPLDLYNGQPGIPGRVTIQDALVQAVLDQVPALDADAAELQGRAAAMNGAYHVETPLLQLVMEAIWKHERAEGSSELRLSTLQNLEGVEKIVDTHLANALRGLSEDERQIAIDAFERLVTSFWRQDRGISPLSGGSNRAQRGADRPGSGEARSRTHRSPGPRTAGAGPHAVPPL